MAGESAAWWYRQRMRSSVTAGDRSTKPGYRRAAEFGRRKYAGSLAEHLWRQLDTIDFIDRAILFAATLLLCFFPFLIVATALAGRSFVGTLTRHLGLNTQASAAVGRLFAPAATTSHAVSGTASAFIFVFGGVAAATALQELYERCFGLDRRGLRDVVRRLTWLGVLGGVLIASGLAGPQLHRVGGPVLLGLTALVWLTGFWWFTIWFLLAGRLPLRAVLPSACATAVLWLAMHVVFSLFFSRMVISQDREYGPIGTVFAIMTYLIAVGVVVILGAAVGIMWRDRGLHLLPTRQKRSR
jgi:membrane protein